MTARVECADALDFLRAQPPASVQLIATDPPYFRVKGEAWDRAWDDSAAFLAWVGDLADEWKRVLAPNGSLYVFASPQMERHVAGVIAERFNVLNVVRWEKEQGWHQKAEKESLRSFLSNWEAVVFAEQFGDQYAEAERALHAKVYAPIGRRVAEKRIAAGLARHEIDTACSPSRKPTGLCYRWEEGACLPTLEQWVGLSRACGDGREYESLRREYESLRREYESLRREYESLRREFSLNDRAQWSDLWQFGTVAPYDGKHVCEKPIALMEHIVRTSSRPGDLVLDCFAGSGTTAVAAQNLGRRFIGCDSSAHWVRWATERLAQQGLFSGEAA